jgi:suppressor for copper-sensitivity B
MYGLLAFLLSLGLPGQATAGDWVGDTRVSARLITAATHVGVADTIDAGIEFRVAPGWHVYWRTPGDAGLPPSVDWGGSTNVANAVIGWPFPTRLIVGSLQNNIYPGSVVLPVMVHLSHAGDGTQLQAHLSYAACGEVCVPYMADLTLRLSAGAALPTSEAAVIAAARAEVPGPLSALAVALDEFGVRKDAGTPDLAVTLRSIGAPFLAPALFVESGGVGGWGVPTVDLSGDRRVATFHVTAPADFVDTGGICLTVVDQGRAASFRATHALGPAEAQRQPPC